MTDAQVPASDTAAAAPKADNHQAFGIECGTAEVVGALSALSGLIAGRDHAVSDDDLSFLVKVIAHRAQALASDIERILHPA